MVVVFITHNDLIIGHISIVDMSLSPFRVSNGLHVVNVIDITLMDQ